jgi:hypothetical protein
MRAGRPLAPGGERHGGGGPQHGYGLDKPGDRVVRQAPLVGVGGRITVVHQGQIGPHPVDEPLNGGVARKDAPGERGVLEESGVRAKAPMAGRWGGVRKPVGAFAL